MQYKGKYIHVYNKLYINLKTVNSKQDLTMMTVQTFENLYVIKVIIVLLQLTFYKVGLHTIMKEFIK